MIFILSGCGCKHENTSVQNAVESTCITDGYSGDIYCNDCQKIIEKGKTIKATGHVEKVVKISAVTCEENGYTGDKICSVCNEVLANGSVVPALGHTLVSYGDEIESTCHSLGYSGTGRCSVCGFLVEGEILAKSEHHYVDDVCAVCGEEYKEIPADEKCTHQYINHSCMNCSWKEPGLYIDGEFVMSWTDLEKKGYVTVANGQLVTCTGNFGGGCLSIGEDVTCLDGNHTHPFSDVDITEIWFPHSIIDLGTYLLYQQDTVTTVYLDCDITAIQECCFRSAKALQKVALPKTIEFIGL